MTRVSFPFFAIPKIRVKISNAPRSGTLGSRYFDVIRNERNGKEIGSVCIAGRTFVRWITLREEFQVSGIFA